MPDETPNADVVAWLFELAEYMKGRGPREVLVFAEDVRAVVAHIDTLTRERDEARATAERTLVMLERATETGAKAVARCETLQPNAERWRAFATYAKPHVAALYRSGEIFRDGSGRTWVAPYANDCTTITEYGDALVARMRAEERKGNG